MVTDHDDEQVRESIVAALRANGIEVMEEAMSDQRPAPEKHDVVVGETFAGHFATCACGWSTGAPDEKGVSQEEIQRRVREHRKA